MTGACCRGGVAHAGQHRLLTLGDQTVELAHEAPPRERPRLRGWLEEDVHGRALHRHLIGAAKGGDTAGRDPGELYRGARGTGALEGADAHDADLNPLEGILPDASRAAAEREVADARRQAEREAHTGPAGGCGACSLAWPQCWSWR